MLIPQYSIRSMLLVTAACAGVFSMFGLAVRGSTWAAGVSVGLVSLVVVLLAHALLFAAVWLFSLLGWQFRGPTARGGRSPFGTAHRPLDATATAKDTPSEAVILE